MSQAELLGLLVSVLGDLGIAHMLVGSQASSFYGEARSTHDVDLVIDIFRHQHESLDVPYLRTQASQIGILSQVNEYLDAAGET